MIIIAGRPGQLGNSLFLFAHFIGFSLEKPDSRHRQLINPSFNRYADYFESTDGDLFCRFPKSKHAFLNGSLLKNAIYHLCFYSGQIIRRLKIENSGVKSIYIDFDQTFDLEANKDHFENRLVFIRGWEFRCPEYFTKHKSAIKKFFTPLKIHLQNIDQLILPVKNNCDLLIGIHIRHGDYKTFEGGKYYYTADQYKEIMQRASALFPQKKITFLVCSNSQESINSFPGINVIKGTNHELEDLYAFSKCNYLIGPPSTYTNWASFYGDVPLYTIHNPGSAFSLDDFKVITG